MENLYPLKLEPFVKEVVWGGRWLADKLGRAGAAEAKLGESWEAYSESAVTNGAWAGRKLGDLFSEYGPALLGQAATRYPKFPLLVKFIDAKQNLSVQVHPDNELAVALENYPFGKTEFWYVIEAEPGAEIYYGLNDNANDAEQLREALKTGDLLRYLQPTPVQAGDVVYIPAGTVHALTKGIVVYELQQDSDITYRLYDWGRTDRPIHIDKGLQAVKLDYKNLTVTHPALAEADGYRRSALISTPYFAADLLEVPQSASLTAPAESFVLLSGLEGSGTLSGQFASQPVHQGDTFLIPAGLPYTLNADAGTFQVIAGWLN